MSNPLTPVVSIAGRVLLCTIFFMAAVGNDIPNFDKMAEVMGQVGMPAPRLAAGRRDHVLLLGSRCDHPGLSGADRRGDAAGLPGDRQLLLSCFLEIARGRAANRK